MKHTRIYLGGAQIVALSLSLFLLAGHSVAQPAGQGNNESMDPDKARVIEHWTQGRRDSATPRDLVIDPRGLGYLRRPDGSLEPHGHQITAEASAGDPTPLARPQRGSDDTVPPDINILSPDNITIGASATFSATVTDATSGVRSVSFIIQYPNNGPTQTFQPTEQAQAPGTWNITLQGFTDGDWSWTVTAKDNAKKGGNSATDGPAYFTVDTGGPIDPVDPDTDTVTNAEWTGGAVQTAVGRLYFEMPNNAKRKGPWRGYVCSGTVVKNTTTARSIILTAAHCVYDDVNKAYARNVVFIPNQAGTTGSSGTDLNCNNDPLGCWVPSYGVVDVDWTTTTFPSNMSWDYAYYVVNGNGAHAGSDSSLESLETAAGALSINFSTPEIDDGTAGASTIDFTHALGYSYSEDPRLMYCAEDMTKEGTVNWWLRNCGLSGGSSGGSWVQRLDVDSTSASFGSGPIISVNSWGYSNSPGMAGPKLVYPSSASCVFDIATSSFPNISGIDGDAGTAVTELDCL